MHRRKFLGFLGALPFAKVLADVPDDDNFTLEKLHKAKRHLENTSPSGLTVELWNDQFFKEYINAMKLFDAAQ